jgi:hypothetical protein
MKKMNFFGKEVSAVLFGILLVAGLGSAALVTYLSNSIDGSVDVDSPVELYVTANPTISESWNGDTVLPAGDSWVQGSFGEFDSIGGESESLWVKIDNEANTVVDKYLVFEITNDMDLTVSEVEDMINGMTVYDWTNSGTTQQYGTYASNKLTITDVTVASEDDTVRVSAPIYLFADGSGDVVYANIDFAFPINAYGNYTVEAAVLMTATADFDSVMS